MRGVEIIGAAQPRVLRVQRFYEDHLEGVPGRQWYLLRGRFDLAHAFYPADAWATSVMSSRGAPPLVFSPAVPLDRRWLTARHYRLEMMLKAASGSGECAVTDEETAERCERYLLRRPQVLDRTAGAEQWEAIYAKVAEGA